MRSERESDLPETVEEAAEWLCADGMSDPAECEDLLRRMVALPDPFGAEGPITPGQAWKWIMEFGYLVKEAPHGWATRDGKMHSSVRAAHERLLYWMGIDFKDAENAGWCRIGPYAYECTFKLSPAQKRMVEKAGLLVKADDERMKPIWNGKPVSRSEIPQAARHP